MEEGVVEKGERKVVSTPWGLTDDVVTLPNKKTYYFFKLPHKVRKLRSSFPSPWVLYRKCVRYNLFLYYVCEYFWK